MLEINVNDNIGVWESFGSIEEALNFVEKLIKERVLNNPESIQLSISVRKGQKTGPPALGVNVSDGVGTSSGLV